MIKPMLIERPFKLLGLIWLFSLAGCGGKPDPDVFIKRHIINPLPTNLVHHSTVSIFQPTLGEGAMTAAYTADEQAWNSVWAARDWKNGYRNLAFEEKATNLFYSVWPITEMPFEVYHLESLDPRVHMLASPDHRELLFSIFE